MGTLQQSQTKKIEANSQKQGASSNNEHLQPVDELHDLVGNQALGHQIKSQNHFNQTTDSSPNLLFRQISTANNCSIQRQPLFRGLSHELIGNGQQGSLVQAKLTINQPDDRYEEEADRVAAEVVKQIHAPVSQPVARAKTTQNKGLIQKAVSSPGTVARGMSATPQVETVIQRLQEQASAPNLDASIQQARGTGESLGAAQTSMEKAFGADFSGVRIHHNSKSDRLSRSIQARAFTTGQDIFFRKGEYAPNSRSGQHLLAHELTHVMHQNNTVQRKPDRSITPSAPQISRAPATSIQRSLMSVAEFDKKTKDRPKFSEFLDFLTGSSFSNVRKELKNLHEDLRSLMVDEKIDRLIRLQASALVWRADNFNDDKKKHKYPLAAEGVWELSDSINAEIESIKDAKKQHQGFEDIYESKIHAPIAAAIERKLGLHRVASLRSKELNLFRQKLKDAARSQANFDIDSVAKEVMQALGKEESEAFQERYATNAKIQAYSESKTFVDEAMRTIAREITDELVPRAETCDILEQVAWQAAREHKHPNEAMLAMFAKAAEIVTAKVDKKGVGIQKARDITKGSQTEQKVEELGNKIKAEVSGDDKKFTKTILKEVIESDTLDRGFQKLGEIVDFVIPNPGCSCEVEIEIQVPLTPPGVYPTLYLITRVVGSAEKDSEEGKQAVETKLNVSLGGGAQISKLLNANAKVGFFFKSNAKTSQKALQLVSYGLYRKLLGDIRTEFFAKMVWGKKGAHDAEKTYGQNAEIWAAAMEELLFYERGDGKVVMENDQKKRNEASVEVGALLEGKGKLGIEKPKVTSTGIEMEKTAGIEVEGQYKPGLLFSAETLGDGLGVHNKTSDQLQKANAGQFRNTFIIKGDLGIEAWGSGVGLGLEAKAVFNHHGLYELEVEVFGKINKEWGKENNRWADGIASIGGSVASAIKKIVDMARAKKFNVGAVGDGIVGDAGFTVIDQRKFLDAGENIGKQLTELTPETNQTIGKQLTELAPETKKTIGEKLMKWTPETKDGVTGEAGKALGAKQSLKLAVKLGGTRTAAGKPFAISLDISVSRLRELSLGGTVAGLGGKAKVETGEKLARLKVGWLGLFHDGKLGGNFLGLGNLGNQSRKIRE